LNTQEKRPKTQLKIFKKHVKPGLSNCKHQHHFSCRITGCEK